MNLSPWIMYLITRLDALNFILSLGLFAAFVWFVVAIIAHTRDGETEHNKKIFKHYGLRFILAEMLIGIVMIMVPTQREMIAILVVPAVVNSEAAQQAPKLAENLMKLLNQEVEKKLDKETAK